MHAAPTDAFIDLLDCYITHSGLDLLTDETLFVETGAGLDIFGLDPFARKRHFDYSVGSEEIGTSQEQSINCIGCCFGSLPVLSLFLLEQPDSTVLDRLRIAYDFVESLDHHGLGFNRSVIPPPTVLGVPPVHAELFIGDAVFPD